MIREAQKKLVHEAQFRVETDFKVDGVFDRPELSFGDRRITLTGRTRMDVNRRSRDAIKTSSTFDFSLTDNESTYRMKGEARRVDAMHYVKLDEVSDAIFPGIKEVKGMWLRSPDAFIGLIIRPVEGNLVVNDLDPDEIVEIERVLSVVPLFEYADTMPSETVDGEKTYHYSVVLRQEALAAIMIRVKELRTDVSSKPEDYALELAKVSSWGDVRGEVWIGKNDWKFRKISLSSLLSEPTGGARAKAEVSFSRFGRPVEFETPDAKDRDDMLGRVISGHLLLAGDRTIDLQKKVHKETRVPAVAREKVESMSTRPPDMSGTDNIVDSDSDGLSDTEEFIYGSDPWNPDTDADGWSDGVEISNGKNPVGPGALFGFGL